MIGKEMFSQFIMAVMITLTPIAILQVNAESTSHSGTVLEVIDAANYTYMNIDENGEKYWIAAPHTVVTIGEKVNFTEQMMMTDFESKTLDRKFDKILFVGMVHKESSGQEAVAETPSDPATMPEGHPAIPAAMTEDQPAIPSTPQTLSEEAQACTIEELFAKKDELKGKLVKVHGDVTKVNDGIMGKNWVHIKDGTGADGSNDIVFTSSNDTAEVGSVVTAQGIVGTDKDYGSGYFYTVIVEEAIFVE